MPVMTILPMAATVAGEDPDTAANNMHAKTDAMAMPPLICPTQSMAKRISLLATPPVERNVADKIKKGIASSV